MSIAEKRIENALVRWLHSIPRFGDESICIRQQVKIGLGSVVDVLQVRRCLHPNNKEFITVTAYEVKVGRLMLSHVEQVLGYGLEILRWRDALLEQKHYSEDKSADFDLDVQCCLVAAHIPDRTLHEWASETGAIQFITYSGHGPTFRFHDPLRIRTRGQGGHLPSLLHDLPWKSNEATNV